MDRFAIYFAPGPDTLLWRLGCHWLGRDAATGESLLTRQSAGRHEEITRQPRHYGFHTTLKPPFALSAGTRLADLEAGLAAYAAGARAITGPALEVARFGGFLALTLCGPCPALDRLCANCVTIFDAWRAPESAEKLESRRRDGLTARQEAMLQRWGYPFVMEEFFFHMTLAIPLEEPELGQVERRARAHFRNVVAMPLFIDRIVLFEELEGAAMRIRRAFQFGRQ